MILLRENGTHADIALNEEEAKLELVVKVKIKCPFCTLEQDIRTPDLMSFKVQPGYSLEFWHKCKGCKRTLCLHKEL
jgi:transposase-like protein